MNPVIQLQDRSVSKRRYEADPDWTGIRSIYQKLSREFDVLLAPYQIKLERTDKMMLDHLIIAIDLVDQFIDDLPTRKGRDEVTTSLVNYLSNQQLNWLHPGVPNKLSASMAVLKDMVTDRNVVDRFTSAAKQIFLNTELKRHTKDRYELISLIKLEGRATAELPLSIMGVDANTPFGKFFTNLCRLMGVADLMIDAGADYRSKCMVVRPSFSLYWNLNSILIVDGIKLLRQFPKKRSFLFYCIRFSISLLAGG